MINFVFDKKETKVSVKLNARRTVSGNVSIFDHPLVDIFIDRANGKVVVFPKDEVSDETYRAQDRLMKELRARGVIDPNSVQGGNIYGTIEALYDKDETESGDPLQHVILAIARYMAEEIPELDFIRSYKKSVMDPVVDPVADESTELGEIPHEKEAGALDSSWSPYNTVYRAYE